jgi:uncharacterized protein
MSSYSPVLVVFCREPRPGVGKQRLAADIGVRDASRVAAALWDCVREDLTGWPGQIVLAVTDHAEESWAARQAQELHGARHRANNGSAPQVLLQPAGNLGERLMAIDAMLRGRGQEQLIFIGSDAPELGCEQLDDIATLLQQADVVLAPALDGGVVAMAGRKPWPALADLPWSSELLGEALAGRCRAAGQAVSLSRGSFDIDDWSSLTYAGEVLRKDRRPARRSLVALVTELMAGRAS